jgi:hypothetical protein
MRQYAKQIKKTGLSKNPNNSLKNFFQIFYFHDLFFFVKIIEDN